MPAGSGSVASQLGHFRLLLRTQPTVRAFIASLWPYFRAYRKSFLWGFLFIVISNGFALLAPGYVREAFDAGKAVLDNAQPGEDTGGAITMVIVKYALLIVGTTVARGIFLFFVRQTIIRTSRRIEFDQKNKLYAQMQGFSDTNLRKRRIGDLLARIAEDVGHVRMFTGPGVMYTFNTITLFIMVLGTMIAINPELTLYTILPLPLLTLLIYLVHKVIIQRSEEKQAQLSDMSSYVQESYSGIRVIRSYNRSDAFRNLFRRESRRYLGKSMRLVAVDAYFFPLMTLLIGLSTTFIVLVGGRQVINGSGLTIGNVAEFFVYLNLLVWPVTALGWVSSLTQRAIASQNRINEIMGLSSELTFPPASADSPTISAGKLELEHVGYTYPETGLVALQDISLTLQPGQCLGIVGRTGSGKTTLVQLLNRMIDPDLGVIRVDGTDLRAFPRDTLRNGIAYVPQDVFLFSDTIAHNIAFGKPDATREEVEAAARFAGVYEDIVDFPNGFDTKIGERGATLSGGQQQRVSIARAYLKKPRILVLDDALSAIDTETEEAILQNLRAPTAGSGPAPTLVIVAHRLSTVQHADQIVVLEDGKPSQIGQHADLITAQGLYARLWAKQQLESELELP